MLEGRAGCFVPKVKLLGPKFIKMCPSALVFTKLALLSILCGKEACAENNAFASGDEIIVVLGLSKKVCKGIAIIDLFDNVGDIMLVGVPRSFDALLVGGDVVQGGLSPFAEHFVKEIMEGLIRDSCEHLGEDTVIIYVKFQFGAFNLHLVGVLMLVMEFLVLLPGSWIWAL